MNTTKIKSIGLGLLLFGSSACSNYLEKETFDIITPDKVWSDSKLIDAVLVGMYYYVQMEDFDYW